MMPFRPSLSPLCIAAGFSLFSFCSICPAQELAPVGQNAPPAISSQPVIRTAANLVLVDVVVTSSGKPVDGLVAQQFHVYENGKEQHITVFEEHRAGDSQQVAHVPSLPAGVSSNIPRFAVTSAVNVLLLDALNTPLSDQTYVRQQMVQYLRRIPSGTRIAVFTLASRLRMLQGFTTDSGTLETAITHTGGNPQQSAVLDAPEDQDTLSDAANSMSTLDSGQMQQFVADIESFRTDQRVSMTLDALAQLGRYLSAIPGRKNLIWFSGSFPLQIDPDPSQSPTMTSNGAASPLDPFSSMRNYSDQVKQTDSLLTAARVAVYPVDARGLMNLASLDAQRSFTASQAMPSASASASPLRRGATSSIGGASGSGQTPAQKADAKFLQQTVNEHQTMQQIAQETGGEAFYDDNGLRDDVAKAIANGSDYFTLGYIPDWKARDGMYHSMQVRVDGAKYDLAYRRGYFAVDPTKPAAESPGAVSPIVAALQRGAPPIAQLVFETRILAATDPAAKDGKPTVGPAGEMALKPPVQRYFADFSIDPHAIAWSGLPNGGAHAEIEVSIVAWNTESARVNYTDHAFAVNLDLAQSTKVLSGGLPLHQEIDLPSGPIFLRVAVHDLRNGRIGSMEIPLKVPKS